jgi:hypothetical protein
MFPIVQIERRKVITRNRHKLLVISTVDNMQRFRSYSGRFVKFGAELAPWLKAWFP